MEVVRNGRDLSHLPDLKSRESKKTVLVVCVLWLR